MRKIILIISLFIITLATTISTFGYETIGDSSIFANIQVTENNQVYFEDYNHYYVSLEDSVTSWSSLMGPSMNYLNVYYSLGSSNVTVNDGNNYIFSDVSILSLYIKYEEPLYLVDVTLYLFDNQGNTLYSEGGYNSLTFPIVTFNFQKIGYNDGYDDGQLYGYDDGLNDGYDEAIEYIVEHGVYSFQEAYNTNTSYNENVGSWDYYRGYNDKDPEADALAIRNLLPGVLGAIWAFFFTIAQFSVLGVSLLDVLVLVLVVGGAIMVIRIVFR